MIVDFNDETNQLNKEQLNDLEQLIVFVLETENMPPHCEVSVSFVTDEQIKQLNLQYRQIEEPTDVLSFPLEQSVKDRDIPNDSSYPLLLGDIIVSLNHAIEQAKQYEHSFKRELSFLVIHGLLHLLGYNHNDATEEKEMFTKQEQILGAFKIERR